MYDTSPLDQIEYNGLGQSLIPFEESQDDIVFNGFSLQNAKAITSDIGADNLPTRDVITFPIPRQSGEILIAAYGRRKEIPIVGNLKGDTKAELNQRIDELKKALWNPEGILDIRRDGIIRRYVAHVESTRLFGIRRNFHITFIPYRIDFVALAGYGEDINNTSSTAFDIPLLEFTQAIDNQGSKETKTEITVLINGATNVTKLEIENTTTNEKMTIERAFSAIEVVQIDSREKQQEVKLNGVAIDFKGRFISLAPGLNYLVFTFTSDNIIYDLTISFKQRYL